MIDAHKEYFCSICKRKCRYLELAKQCEHSCDTETHRNLFEVAELSAKHNDDFRFKVKSIKDFMPMLHKELESLYKLNIRQLTMGRITFETSLSNTHTCPLNGVTNFLSEANKPTGYSGYRFEMRIKADAFKKGYLNFSPEMLGEKIYIEKASDYKIGSAKDIICGLRGLNTNGYSGHIHTVSEEEFYNNYFIYISIYLEDFPHLRKEIAKLKLLGHKDREISKIITNDLLTD